MANPEPAPQEAPHYGALAMARLYADNLRRIGAPGGPPVGADADQGLALTFALVSIAESLHTLARASANPTAERRLTQLTKDVHDMANSWSKLEFRARR